MKIYECDQCGLVSLGKTDHIDSSFYKNSGMHGAEPPTMAAWLKDAGWDDQRRFEMLKAMLPNKKVLDFGCGAGGFLERARTIAAEVAGVELERRVREYWGERLTLHENLSTAGDHYDLITAFHVVEHLADPRAMLRELTSRLKPQGRLIVEVPSSEDALLTLFDNASFQRFTYWSQHLFLFNSETLRHLALQAGLRVIAIEQFQRYPLSNHLYWLSQGKPGGHQRWAFLSSAALNDAYANALASVGMCDTLIAHLERVE